MMRAHLPLLCFLIAFPAVLAAQRSPLDSANARAATDDYRRTGRARVVQTGTYSMVPFDHVQPTLQCAPARVCTIELQSGERVIDHVLGDSHRWVVEFGMAQDSTPLVATKPVGPPDACDLTTNLVVTTDRRTYHFTLDSPPCPGRGEGTNPILPYMSRMKFYYPDEALVHHHAAPEPWESASAVRVPGVAGAGVPAAVAEEVGAAMPVSDLGELHFDYRATPDRGFPWVPRVIFDNGRQTCIRLPPEAYHSDLAVLYELNARGDYELVQYVVRDGCILTDRVMQRMVLLIPGGQGGDPLRLLIVRLQPRGAR